MRGASAMLMAVVALGSACRAAEGEGTRPAATPPRTPAPGPGAAVVLEPAAGPPVRVRVEVARTPEERSRGLMFRRSLEADAGMIFLFDAPEHQAFWMHNTYVPLDMLFIGSDLRVVGVVENAAPLTDDERSVPGLSQYVLEVNAGFCRRNRIGIGTLARFEGVPGH